MDEYTWKIGDEFSDGTYRWKVDMVMGDRAVLRSCGSSATTRLLTYREWHEGHLWKLAGSVPEVRPVTVTCLDCGSDTKHGEPCQQCGLGEMK